MGLHVVNRGLDVPVDGAPQQVIEEALPPARVALLADDSPDLHARVCVREGDRVVRGQPLFEDRASPGVLHAAPATGCVQAVHRGERRALRSIVLRLDESELRGDQHVAQIDFAAATRRGEAEPAEGVRALLVESGLWTAFCARPFGKVPPVAAVPHALFVTAIDTQPLAPRPEVVLAGECLRDFQRGLRLVAKLCPGTTYLCIGADSPLAELIDAPVAVERFAGPHPAGSPGLHVHLLAPVDRRRSAWTIGYQDVIAVGRLFADGRLPVERVVALAGPGVRRPRLLRTRRGAALADLCKGELADGDWRVLSGSVLNGKKAMGPVFGFLGRADLQVSVLHDTAHPGGTAFSTVDALRALLGRRRGAANTTAVNGRRGPVVPVGAYERVLPMDLLPTLLLRALVAGDDESAERLGCLELLEEDLALCSFVCPGKNDYGPALRAALRRLEEEG